ncbi:cell division control protein [Thecamonas trahens ATCC 50062]|uniref:Cell division control protein n=1 Tax=Thecamonas trahens ATCC 50062 TaxID=461836 RepID=A0A0L0DSH0_THETB|nr:cell division control protein [Thecamonas trahens ATCC 50062]KNC54398.1 cell division control protein [Thecamonas trahens ATCC 50062]|eukprot:XP_013753696.1 cell division control protein [Thecamonas trahens ATCC 50062]
MACVTCGVDVSQAYFERDSLLYCREHARSAFKVRGADESPASSASSNSSGRVSGPRGSLHRASASVPASDLAPATSSPPPDDERPPDGAAVMAPELVVDQRTSRVESAVIEPGKVVAALPLATEIDQADALAFLSQLMDEEDLSYYANLSKKDMKARKKRQKAEAKRRKKLAKETGASHPDAADTTSSSPSAHPSDAPDLKFDDGGAVVGGSPARLVERLTYERHPTPTYMQTFMLTFRSFATPRELVQLLARRFNTPTPATLSDEAKLEHYRQTLVPIRLRVLNAFKFWISTHWYDFEADDGLCDVVIAFARNTLAACMPGPAAAVVSKIERMRASGRESAVAQLARKQPKPVLPKVLKANPDLDIAAALAAGPDAALALRDIPPLELAPVCAVEPRECVSKQWSRVDAAGNSAAPNISAIAARFNTVSRWVASAIVSEPELKKRKALMAYFLKVAGKCAKLNNFNSTMAILAGFHSSAVYRLKMSWDGLPKSAAKAYAKLEALTNSASNYKQLRAALRKSNPPAVPYLGMFLTDLTFVEDGLPAYIDAADAAPSPRLINFTKLRKVATVIRGIQLFQHEPYSFVEVPALARFLRHDLHPLTDDDMYRLSLDIEPRGAYKSKSKSKSKS